LCEFLFLKRVIVFENLRKTPESSSPAWLPTAHQAYNKKSHVIRLKTDNWQYATQLIAEK